MRHILDELSFTSAIIRFVVNFGRDIANENTVSKLSAVCLSDCLCLDWRESIVIVGHPVESTKEVLGFFLMIIASIIQLRKISRLESDSEKKLTESTIFQSSNTNERRFGASEDLHNRSAQHLYWDTTYGTSMNRFQKSVAIDVNDLWPTQRHSLFGKFYFCFCLSFCLGKKLAHFLGLCLWFRVILEKISNMVFTWFATLENFPGGFPYFLYLIELFCSYIFIN